jgi:L-Ala-D/L-Glu epimerase
VAREEGALPENVCDVERFLSASSEYLRSGVPAPARCAVEMALLDRIGKRREKPLWELLELEAPANLPTAFTISIDAPDAMARMAKEITDYPVIKIKLGSDDDESRVRAVREARPEARLFIDANAGWKFDEAVANLKWLAKYDIELIEQPVAKDEHAAMGELQKRTDVPIVADESVQSLEDVEKLGAAGVRGVNVKLMKLGGILPAVRIIRRAREMNMKIMLGCMIETSLGITAMAHLSGLADWLDLDAPLLIGNDPFAGIMYDSNGKISVPRRAGIGVIRR